MALFGVSCYSRTGQKNQKKKKRMYTTQLFSYFICLTYTRHLQNHTYHTRAE